MKSAVKTGFVVAIAIIGVVATGIVSAGVTTAIILRDDDGRGVAPTLDVGGGPGPVVWRPKWAFVARIVLPASGIDGHVAAVLTSIGGDDPANATTNESLTVELGAASWPTDWPSRVNATTGAPTLLAAINENIAANPLLGFTRSSMSRDGDAVVMTVPQGNVTTVFAYAPLSGEFMFFDWSQGRAFTYDTTRAAWVWQDGVPAILAEARGPQP